MHDSIRELMDSCRPDGEDLRQPEMQPLADLIAADAGAARQLDRSRQLDAAISSTVHAVPIPAGLEQRLLAALTESAAESSAAEPPALPDADSAASEFDVESSPAVDAGLDLVTPRVKPVYRSWRLWAALATCAAAIVCIPFVANRQPTGEVGYQELVASALSWEPSQDGWSSDNMIWTNHPLPDEMPALRLDGRQQVDLPHYQITASCYRVLLRGGSARIFVFDKPPGFSLPAGPPDTPMSTQGKCVAAWSSGGLAYVLVLDGGEQDYIRSIRSISQVTVWRPERVTLCPTRTA